MKTRYRAQVCFPLPTHYFSLTPLPNTSPAPFCVQECGKRRSHHARGPICVDNRGALTYTGTSPSLFLISYLLTPLQKARQCGMNRPRKEAVVQWHIEVRPSHCTIPYSFPHLHYLL